MGIWKNNLGENKDFRTSSNVNICLRFEVIYDFIIKTYIIDEYLFVILVTKI